MKKISVVLIFILAFLFAPAVHAEVQDTLSDEILVQAKAQADLFLELKNALGLDWLDKYNAYLQNPSVNPEPSWSLSIQDLINNGYLSAGFPSDFSLSPSGAEVVISRQISTQSIRDAVTIYLPSATISGNTVSLLVQRPAQWIAWQDALNGKVSRDGSGDPDILPGADLDFGSGSKIEFVSSDGKILGVDSLTYKGEELEDRFVNVSGDNMTGPLYIEGNKVWHAGNDGSGSGLDADLLDGQHGSYYLAAENLTGIVPAKRLDGIYGIDISGNAATATNANYASSAGNADTVDGKHASDFALSGHTHGEYLNKINSEGDTMRGPLGINFENGITSGIGSHNIKGTGSTNVVGKGFKIDWDTDFGFVGLVDKGADRKDMVFANEQTGDNFVFMSQGMEIMALKPKDKILEIDGYKVLTTGDYGHRDNNSGINADMLDGKHLDYILDNVGKSLVEIRTTLYADPGTYTWSPLPKTTYVVVQLWSGGGGGAAAVMPFDDLYFPVDGGNGGNSSFGSYFSAVGGRGGSRSTGGSAGYGSGGSTNISGKPGGTTNNYRGGGGGSLFIEGYNPEGGGGGSNSSSTSRKGGGGGGSGGYAKKGFYINSISTPVQVVVGAGGAGGVGSGEDGLAGRPGRVVISEYGIY